MAAPELKEAASIVSDHVNRLAGRVQSSLASSDRYMVQTFFCLSCSLGRWTLTISTPNCICRHISHSAQLTEQFEALETLPVVVCSVNVV